MKLLRLHPLLWLVLAPAVMCAAGFALQPNQWLPVNQKDLHIQQVQAYRQWQSMGLELREGDQFEIRAAGEWSYSPFAGRHGPEGGQWAPDWYPLTGNRDRALGGVLLGRIGDEGTPFAVGRRFGGYASTPGLLYLRINDDLLGDNAGTLVVQISVTPAPTPAP